MMVGIDTKTVGLEKFRPILCFSPQQIKQRRYQQKQGQTTGRTLINNQLGAGDNWSTAICRLPL